MSIMIQKGIINKIYRIYVRISALWIEMTSYRRHRNAHGKKRGYKNDKSLVQPLV